MTWLDSITNSMDMNLGKLQDSGEQQSLACCSPCDAESDIAQLLYITNNHIDLDIDRHRYNLYTCLLPETLLNIPQFFFLIFIVVQLVCIIVLVSSVQQSESVIHIHMSTPFLDSFPIQVHIGHYRVLSKVFCATPYQLSMLYIARCICQSNLPIYPSPPLFLHSF